jgi:hypothetical protein
VRFLLHAWASPQERLHISLISWELFGNLGYTADDGGTNALIHRRKPAVATVIAPVLCVTNALRGFLGHFLLDVV